MFYTGNTGAPKFQVLLIEETFFDSSYLWPRSESARTWRVNQVQDKVDLLPRLTIVALVVQIRAETWWLLRLDRVILDAHCNTFRPGDQVDENIDPNPSCSFTRVTCCYVNLCTVNYSCWGENENFWYNSLAPVHQTDSYSVRKNKTFFYNQDFLVA